MSALVLAFLIVSKFGGEEILSGLASTTLFRVITSDTTTSTMLGRITIWGGGVYALAFIRLALYVRQDLATGLLLFASSLLVPIYHVGRGEMVSQHKHMAFALFFAAPLAGCASNYWATVGMATVCRGRPYAAERESSIIVPIVAAGAELQPSGVHILSCYILLQLLIYGIRFARTSSPYEQSADWWRSPRPTYSAVARFQQFELPKEVRPACRCARPAVHPAIGNRERRRTTGRKSVHRGGSQRRCAP